MEGLERIVLQHPFFKGLETELGSSVSGCARNRRFKAEEYLFHEGEPADEFFLIREGAVALETCAAGQASAVMLTLGEGDLVGVSWLLPPYRWNHDARALRMTRAIGIDCRCLRTKCEADHDLGYHIMQRLMAAAVRRLQLTRLQILDVYRKPEA